MDRPYTMHPYIELKSFGISPYSPVLNTSKSPLASPIARVHAIKPIIPHSIDNILGGSGKKSPPRSPSPDLPARHRPYYIPSRGFEYRPALPVYWSGLVHPSWRDRFTGNRLSLVIITIIILSY